MPPGSVADHPGRGARWFTAAPRRPGAARGGNACRTIRPMTRISAGRHRAPDARSGAAAITQSIRVPPSTAVSR
jgi:hypothetical protein